MPWAGAAIPLCTQLGLSGSPGCLLCSQSEPPLGGEAGLVLHHCSLGAVGEAPSPGHDVAPSCASSPAFGTRTPGAGGKAGRECLRLSPSAPRVPAPLLHGAPAASPALAACCCLLRRSLSSLKNPSWGCLQYLTLYPFWG